MDEQQEIEQLQRLLEQRQRRPRGPRRIRETLSQLMARRGYGQTESRGRREAAWREAAGPLASQTRVGNISRGVLTVFVSNSLVMQELTFQQQQILRRLAESGPDLRVRALRLRTGAID